LGGGGVGCTRPFRTAIRRFKHVGGGIDRDGRMITKPWELEEAELIDGFCQRYSCLPSQLLEEDATILRMLAIVHEGKPEDNG
jgi:hypothetical protein